MLLFILAAVAFSPVSAAYEGCENPLFLPAAVPTFVPNHLRFKLRDVFLQETPTLMSHKMCNGGKETLSCCTESSYQVLEGIYNAQHRHLLLSKAQLERMPDPTYFLDTALLILLDLDAVKNDTEVSTRLSSLHQTTANLTARVNSAAQHASQCMDRLLEFEAGMLCLACSAEHGQYMETHAKTAMLMLNISTMTRAAILGSCCDLATDLADVFDLANEVRNYIVNESDTLELSGPTSMSFLAHVNFPSSSILRKACPANIVKQCHGLTPDACTLRFHKASSFSNATEFIASAGVFVTTMAGGLDLPSLPRGFEATSFVHTGFGTMSRPSEARVRCQAAPMVAEDRRAGTKASCNSDCNKIPKFCPSSLCDCREEPIPIVRNDTQLFKIVGTTFLRGYDQLADFTPGHQRSFRNAIATVVAVALSQVHILNMTAVATSGRRSLRELEASDSIRVHSLVISATRAEAAGVKSTLQMAASNATILSTAFSDELVASGTASVSDSHDFSVAVEASSLLMEVEAMSATGATGNYSEGIVQTSFDPNGYNAVDAGADSSLVRAGTGDEKYLGIVSPLVAWTLMGILIFAIVIGLVEYILFYWGGDRCDEYCNYRYTLLDIHFSPHFTLDAGTMAARKAFSKQRTQLPMKRRDRKLNARTV
jgi:hypothetical protein